MPFKIRLLINSIVLMLSLGIAHASSLLVMGDSLSAAHNLRQQDGWVSLLKTSLAHSYPNLIINNASVSGETSQGGLARFPALLKEYSPNWVILELGANDALRGYPLDQTQANLGAMIEQAHNANAEVLLLGNRIPQNYGKRYTEMFFGLYKTLADQYNLAYLPFMLKDVATDKALMQQDGLHPTAEGQKQVLKNIQPYIIPLLDKEKKQ
ncbi:arylesterase [Marinomonas pollencensis]|uniref:Acyl-CoA thioesterase-1 n=1 Tax=Marinomonas pollencensis TaxID=491954 RepID=A0A3E0DRE3_9GAMM|nr:arylesterase [Marinomonas pollencensis]REG85680.1 acyl-CoA thioesterase-1 [Marinomonas pollencensis]